MGGSARIGWGGVTLKRRPRRAYAASRRNPITTISNQKKQNRKRTSCTYRIMPLRMRPLLAALSSRARAARCSAAIWLCEARQNSKLITRNGDISSQGRTLGHWNAMWCAAQNSCAGAPIPRFLDSMRGSSCHIAVPLLAGCPFHPPGCRPTRQQNRPLQRLLCRLPASHRAPCRWEGQIYSNK